MAANPGLARGLFVLSVVLLVVVAAIVAGSVIPQVQASSVPSIDPGAAVPAFRVAVFLHVAVAVLLAAVARWSKGRSRFSTPVLVIAGIAVLLFGFVLSDAAVAMFEAAGDLRTTGGLLVACVLMDVAAGGSTIAGALLRSPRQAHVVRSA